MNALLDDVVMSVPGAPTLCRVPVVDSSAVAQYASSGGSPLPGAAIPEGAVSHVLIC